MMTPPSQRDFKTIPFSKFTSKFSFARGMVNSESLLNPLLRTPAEWCGMSGLSFKDTQAIFPNAISVYEHWKNESNIRNDWDLFDFKTNILTTVVVPELHIRKFRLFADSIDANAVLPFANQKVAQYFAKMSEKHLIDRKTLKNKLILREMLKNKIGLDSDKLGKMGFSYDSRSIVLQNLQMITDEIYSCKLWDKEGMQKVVSRLKETMQSTNKYAELSGRLIYRIYLLSGWHNKNSCIND
jgi:asparagine synthase (glutamine-hydrolysing)